ncbi:MAG TPA: oligopeptide transporter, OPT family [Vicinamibacteria bacterium]|nr:oligopeptide transporter, OPT family [Vicinamibacteria bacterium]
MAQEDQAADFTPYVPDSAELPEFTFRAVALGIIFGIIFGAVTVYVGLRAGLTVAASIPIAVLSISLLRALGRATILENNIVQTTGSAGESVAGGVIFTLPALIFLGFSLEYSRTLLLALIGGWLGVLFMIPLRRQLIVKEHGNLLYPEGTACADVLVAGEKGGSFAGRVFSGLGLGSLYTLLQNSNAFAVLREEPQYNPSWLPGASPRATITSEYLGVGYIIGPRVAGVIFAGGIFSWMVMMPAIKFFGSGVPGPIYPGTIPIADMGPRDIWITYIRPMGAGAVAAAGLITLIKTVPTIVAALKAGLADLKKRGDAAAAGTGRTARDLSTSLVVVGSAAIVLFMCAFLTLKPVPGTNTSLFANLLASVLVVVFGFLFVTVSSRIVGLIGTSANPISGMAIATLMATCGLFLILGWTAPAFAALALTIGGTVCIAAANAGNTSQDLKTGFLVGATPAAQQKGLFLGVATSCLVIGVTLILMNKGLESFEKRDFAVDLAQLPEGVTVENPAFEHAGRTYTLLNVIGSPSVPQGKYLLDAGTGRVELQWIQGIGSDKAPAPQAQLMSTVINGILTRKLPWGLVFLGVFLVIAVELLGIRSLSFAVGSYLSIGTTAAIFAGGLVRWLAERDQPAKKADDETSPGALYASGLIAAGGIVGLLAIVLRLLGISDRINFATLVVAPVEAARVAAEKVGQPLELTFGQHAALVLHSPWVGMLAFAALAFSLYHFARKPLEGAR